MAKKAGSSGFGGGFIPGGVGLLAHLIVAACGWYRCGHRGCHGTLDVTFRCRNCGRRGFPRFGTI